MIISPSHSATDDLISRKKNSTFVQRIVKYRYAYLLLLPCFLYFFIFKLIPYSGLVIAFQDYSPFTGVWRSNWVGLKHFVGLFTNNLFYLMIRNTFAISLMNIALYFPVPIILALMLNEISSSKYKRVNQSILYIPHFMSWVVISGLTFFLLSVDVGLINKLLTDLGREPIMFLSTPGYFWLILTAQSIWRDAGWGTILLMAAISGIDQELYEAAVADGAGRMTQIWHITLPSIANTIVVLLILRIGRMFHIGLEQILLMSNPMVFPVAEVFDTYAYRVGIQAGQASVGTAVGLFKGIVNVSFVLGANALAKKAGHDGIY